MAGELLDDELSVKNETKIRNKKVVNRSKSSGKPDRPTDVSKRYADIMSVVQHNGHVTLPGVSFSDGFLTNVRFAHLVFCSERWDWSFCSKLPTV